MKREKDSDLEKLYLYFHDVAQHIEKFEKEEGFANYFLQIKRGEKIDEADELKNRIGSYVYCGLVRDNRIISENEMFEIFERNINEVIRMNRGDKWFEVMQNIFDGAAALEKLFMVKEANILEASAIYGSSSFQQKTQLV